MLQWRGVDDPERLDAATVLDRDDGFDAIGVSRTREFVLRYVVDVGGGWLTRSIAVDVTGLGWSRSLVLRRDGQGRWSSEQRAEGGAGLEAPGLVDPAELDGALDCDLGLCPLTNTMPIRRLGMTGGPVDETVLRMAWVEVPSLRVLPNLQRYTGLGVVDDVPRVRYESEARDFRSELRVDAAGYVVDYPGLARALLG